jgi:hypothetical protein
MYMHVYMYAYECVYVRHQQLLVFVSYVYL